ncbi:MAG: hypothetical protein ACOYNL_04755 [Rickettsiales bacterium]
MTALHTLEHSAHEHAESTAAAENIGEQVDAEIQLQIVEEKLRVLAAKAEEIQREANKLMDESAGEAATDALHAKACADTMRGTVAANRDEISNAKDARTGKTKLSPTRLTAMSNSLSHILLGADNEKAALVEAHGEAISHIASKSTATGITKSVTATVSHVIHKATKVAAPSVAVSIGPSFHLPQWHRESIAAVRNTGVQLAEIAGNAWESTSRFATKQASKAANIITEYSVAAVDYTKKAAIAAGETFTRAKDATVAFIEEKATQADTNLITPAKNMVKKAAGKTVELATDAMTATRDAAEKVSQSIKEKYQAAKTALSRLNLFAEKEPVKAETKPATPTVKTAVNEPQRMMARAMQQAAAITLPISLQYHSMADSLGISVQSLPKIQLMATHMHGLY